MTDKPTPGPWKERDGNIFVVEGGDAQLICGIGKGTGLGLSEYYPIQAHKPQGMTNARLIAAAPDFVEPADDAADLLEQYAEFIRSVKADDLERHPYLPLVEDCIRGLRAALAKARGEA